MSYSRSTRTVRSYQYSSDGGAPTSRTEVTTRTYGGDGGPSTTFSVSTSGGNNDIQIGRSGGVPKMPTISSSRSVPTQRGYKSGWGTRRDADPSRALPKQDADDIRSNCQSSGSLFEDPDFPAIDTSIFYSRAPPRPFVWKRPSEFCDDPQLFVGGASRFDVQQGELGDCWLLAAVASLSLNKQLLYKVVPPSQSFDPSNGYCGMFKFCFWQYGKWIDVIVDDRLPTYYDKLVFMHSTEKNEFWSALLEKAYAKLVGSYEALKGGSTTEAMEDFTGGVTEMFDMAKPPQDLFQIMLKARERRSLMGCSINANPNQLEAELSNGLIMGHAYSITDVKLVDVRTGRVSGKIPLVRIRNPWGNEAEWNGPWSDKSAEWNCIDASEREELGLTFSDDGEFWMSFKDFSSNFQKMEICNLGPDALTEEDSSQQKKTWSAKNEDGQWIRRASAGGCRNFLETFWSNPQFRVTVTDPDDDDDDNLCTVIIGLMQKERRKKRKEGLDLLTIGYAVYKLKEEGSDDGTLGLNFFKYNASCAKSPSFVNTREVCGRHRFEPGTYAIVPSTFEPQQEGDFLLRIFSEKKSEASAIDENTKYEEIEAPEPTNQDHEQTEAMRQVFRRIAGEDMEIDAYELRDILNTAFMQDGVLQFRFDGFSVETCRSMVAMKDEDHSGKLGFEEFKELWDNIRLWKGIFKEFDKDKSGNLSSYELRIALNMSGFRVRNATFQCLVMRYANKEGVVAFDDFILCAVRLKSMFETFKEKDAEDTYRKGQAVFALDEFIQTTMYS